MDLQQIIQLSERLEKARFTIAMGRIHPIIGIDRTQHTTMYAVEAGDGDGAYLVLTDPSNCTCPDYKKNGSELGWCKHIMAVEIYREQDPPKQANHVQPQVLDSTGHNAGNQLTPDLRS